MKLEPGSRPPARGGEDHQPIPGKTRGRDPRHLPDHARALAAYSHISSLIRRHPAERRASPIDREELRMNATSRIHGTCAALALAAGLAGCLGGGGGGGGGSDGGGGTAAAGTA